MKKSTGELLNLLKKTNDIRDYLEEMSDDLLTGESLAHYLEQLLQEKNLKKSDVIKRSGLDKGYCYEIFSGGKLPSRNKLLALCFAMNLNELETQNLLKHSAYPQLYARMERDSILLFSLQHHLSITDVNELLYEMNYELLE